MSAAFLALEPEKVGAGPLGLLVVVLMGIATVLLIRNMNTRIKGLPKQFPPPGAEATQAAEPAESADSPAEAAGSPADAPVTRDPDQKS